MVVRSVCTEAQHSHRHPMSVFMSIPDAAKASIVHDWGFSQQVYSFRPDRLLLRCHPNIRVRIYSPFPVSLAWVCIRGARGGSS